MNSACVFAMPWPACRRRLTLSPPQAKPAAAALRHGGVLGDGYAAIGNGCINANSAMNPVFQGNGKLCINVLNHEQEIMARHFAG
ncbi:4-hydroxyphenylacetate 3-monooxygenase [Klebsiella pneumoniae]|uniref:4-hydroxyphenylacetate 3-monooxygenase n=1 Tax=Klebsiella pneumoniae TaxID=573 RepID=A0A2X3ESW7_KLEPN|nr:4-hydroxyphenylacetate 3-monooxygenase [Klebsiella pneumoniae]